MVRVNGTSTSIYFIWSFTAYWWHSSLVVFLWFFLYMFLFRLFLFITGYHSRWLQVCVCVCHKGALLNENKWNENECTKIQFVIFQETRENLCIAYKILYMQMKTTAKYNLTTRKIRKIPTIQWNVVLFIVLFSSSFLFSLERKIK